MRKKIDRTPLSVRLNKAIDAKKDTRLNGWAIRYEDGTGVLVPFYICCSLLNRGQKYKPISEFIFSVRHRNHTMSWTNHPRWNEFLHFMLNHSFIRDVFLTKNVGNANKHGVRMNISYDSNRMLAGFFFLRCAWEYEWYLDSFFWMVDAGVDKNVALALCQYIERVPKGINKRGNTGHTPFSILSKEDFIRLLTTDMWKKEQRSPVSKGTFHEFAVNKVFSSKCIFVDDLFLYNGLVGKKYGSGWDIVFLYSEEDVLNKVKEAQGWLK